MTVTFWEKPGCKGNARQKALLLASGYKLNVKSLPDEPWTAERLHGFFNGKPVADWFNRSSPRVKSGEILPESQTPDSAINLMLADPLLIRRPLIEFNGKRCSGFEPDSMKGWIDIKPELLEGGQAPETCLGQADNCHAN